MRQMQWRSYRCRIFLLSCMVFLGSVCTGAAASMPEKDTQDSPQELVFLPAYQLASLIRTGEVTSSEVVDAFLDQISLHNKKLNAIVTLWMKKGHANGHSRQMRPFRRVSFGGLYTACPLRLKTTMQPLA